MTTAIERWLPVNVADRPSVRAAIQGTVTTWSSDWVGTDAFSVTSFVVTAANHSAIRSPDDWRRPRRVVEVRYSSANAANLLMSLILDAPIDRLEMLETDQQVVSDLEKALLGDLCQRLEAVLSLAAPEREGVQGERLVLHVAHDERREVLKLSIPVAALTAFILTSLPSPRPVPKLQANLTAAFANVSTPIEAVLGDIRLSLSELTGLRTGDVLVLDRKLDDPATLVFAGSRRSIARAALTEPTSPMSLTVV